ncbi:MAG: cysteine desulfurase [Ignavibacteriales bacterium]|nr:cysteine desulfurase [Ignavibacteriales bacterium]
MSLEAHLETTRVAYDVHRVRKDFPILSRKVQGKPLVYLDNAATSQKPASVLKAIREYYESYNANIHRGVHALSIQATEAYESVRRRIQEFVGAREAREVVFVRGTTEGINLVAQTFARRRMREGDEILISGLEHHSNIVPWQILCEQSGAKLRVIPLNDAGELMLDEYEALLTQRTRIVALGHVSNALGTINPVKQMIAAAHRKDIPVLIDGAQAVPHLRVDIQDLDAEFYVFSGHKMFGPTGIGCVVGKAALLEEMPPYQGGGDMIKSVSFEKTVYNDIPYKFEAGTPNIAGVMGLGAAVEYLTAVDHLALEAYEHELLEYATQAVSAIDGVRIIGTAAKKTGVLSFIVNDVHPHDVGTILDREGIAVRTGHHCAQPVMQRFGVPATIRASLALYNTSGEIDALVRGLHKVKEVFG